MKIEEKQTRQKFKNQAEREKKTKERKKKNQRDSRAKRNGTVKAPINNFEDKKSLSSRFYQNAFQSINRRDFNAYITLTCKYNVTISFLIAWVGNIIDKLKKNHVIGNYFIVYEHNGDNYHVHILLESHVFIGVLKPMIKSFWKHGITDTSAVNTQYSKVKCINYMTKQLQAKSRSNLIQTLIDSWDLHLTDCDNFKPTKTSPFYEPNLAHLSGVKGGGGSCVVECKSTSMTAFFGVFYMLWMILTEQYKSFSMAQLYDAKYL